GGLADRLWTRRVIDTEGLPLVVTHIGVDPGDAVIGVAVDHGQAGRCPLRINGDVESFRKDPLHDVSRHSAPPCVLFSLARVLAARLGAALPSANREDYPHWRLWLPIFARRPKCVLYN